MTYTSAFTGTMTPNSGIPLPPSMYQPQYTREELKSALHKQARIEKSRLCSAKGDVLGWGQALMPQKFSLPFCALHQYIVDHRLDELAVLEAARGHAKTTCSCMLVPLYQALNEPEAYRHYLMVQATDEKALAVNNSIKLELEQNELIRYAYGSQIGTERWTNGQFVLKNGVCFTAVGAGQSIRGINYRNHRPDNINLDDLYNEDDINNVDSTKKKNDWFWSVLFPSRAKGKKSRVSISGTPANNEDLLEKLKKREGWSHGTFRAAEDVNVGPVLWKELNTLEQLQRDMKNMPLVIFYREMMCERRDDASSIIKREWLQSWEYDPVDLKFDAEFQYVGGILGIDPSIGKREENDCTGMAFVIKGQRSDGSLPVYYIEGLTNAHMSFQERLDAAKAYCADRHRERPATKVNVEGISGFTDFGDKVAASVSIPCEVIKRVPDKITHLEKKSHYFQNRRIFLNKNIEGTLKDALAYQLVTNHPKHDDLRDALLHALDDESTSWASWV